MGAVDDIKLYFFHHHHYIDIPENHERFRTSMVDYPNTQYDPERGARALRAAPALDDARRRARLRRHRINEHHSMVYSMTPDREPPGGAAT